MSNSIKITNSSQKKWNVIKETNISPSSWFPLYIQSVRLPNGNVLDDYYISKLNNISIIIPITKDKKVVMVQQYKHAAGEVLLEFPAGFVEKNSNAEKTALKELKEETGIIAQHLKFLGESYALPTKLTTKIYGFIAENAEIRCSQAPDSNEDIQIIFLSLSELEQKIKSNQIKSSDTIAMWTLAKLLFPYLF